MKKIKITQILLTMVCSLVLLTGCGQDTNKVGETDTSKKTEVTIDQIHEAVKNAYGENYLPNMSIDGELLNNEFNITEDMYEEVKAEQPMIGVHADRVVIVKAKEGKADEVEAALNNARENKINDTFQYPMNVAKINASKVIRQGDYVIYLLVGAVNDAIEVTEEEAKVFAEEEVEKAVSAIEYLFQ